MKGADEYYDLFPQSEQFGKLVVIASKHARGKTFRIFVVPKDYNHDVSSIPRLGNGAVEVYGIVSGQPGWTEEYGWLHEGKWQEDFAKIVAQRKLQVKEERERQAERNVQAEQKEAERIAELLSKY
jgi:hypothetical protein